MCFVLQEKKPRLRKVVLFVGGSATALSALQESRAEEEEQQHLGRC
jgi:hypothetical protein